MRLPHRSLLACLAFTAACASNRQPTAAPSDPGTAPAPESPDPAAEEPEVRRAKPRAMTATRGAQIDRKRIVATRPPKQKKPTRTQPPAADDGAPIALAGVVPTVTSVGGLVELFGSGLNKDDLAVRIGGKDQTIVSKDADRVVVRVENPKGGKVAVGTKNGNAFKSAATAGASLAVLENDGGFGKPRTQVDQGLVGTIYAIEDTPEELPVFDDLGAPIGTIAVDRVDIPSGEFEQKMAGREGNFGIHFRGSLNIVEGGDYDFCLAAGDGALLFLDGSEIVDNDGAHETKEVCSLVAVEPGEYQLDLLWYQGEPGELGLQFRWAKDGGRKQVVPSDVLFPPADLQALAR